MPKTVYSIEDVPLSEDDIQDFYERWRYPEITEMGDDTPSRVVIDEDTQAHFGFLVKDPDLRQWATQTEYRLENYRDSIELFRDLYLEVEASLPEEITVKEKIVYCKLIFGDSMSAPSNSLFNHATPVNRTYANEFHYNRQTQQVFQREQIPRSLRDDLIEEYGRCPRCGYDTDLEIHHIIPYSVGGVTEKRNLAPLCGACHQDAHHAYMDEVSGYTSVKGFWDWVLK